MDNEVLGEIVDTIWQTVFGVGIQRGAAVLDTTSTAVTGCIRFSGAWPGSLTASCSEALAHRIANAMFMPEGEVSDEDVSDAFGEVVNMMGGNLKAILPGACQLSLPAVFLGADARSCAEAGDIVTTACFVVEGESLIVRLFRRSEG